MLQNDKVKKFIDNIFNNPLNPPLTRGRRPLSPLNKGGRGGLLVFKNTLQIEKTCAENGWKLLNPPAKISNAVEEKISQIAWLGPLKKYLPKYQVLKCKNIKIANNYFLRSEDACESEASLIPQRVKNNYLLSKKQEKNNYQIFSKPFILQFNRSHTGSGTMLIENEKQLIELQKTFPEREVRIAEYIPGPLFTNNNIVTKNNILLGNINYQITGLKPFTDLPFSTIGNDWALPHKILNQKQITQYKKIATEVGKRLQKAGWLGLFGIDVVVNEMTGKLYLLEINCRQPASTTYESQLQSKVQKSIKSQVTTFQAHLSTLLNIDLKNKKLTEINNGAQVILRNSQKSLKSVKSKVTRLKKEKFNVIEYNNTKPNSDLVRIQSEKGIMEEHNGFNSIGNKIIKIISNSPNF